MNEQIKGGRKKGMDGWMGGKDQGRKGLEVEMSCAAALLQRKLI
jgi:hypothetical protein